MAKVKYHNVRDANGRFASSNGTKKSKGKKKTVKKTQVGTTILSAFLMDSSGSMSGKENATISGFNEILANARNDAKKYNTPSVELIAFFGDDYKFYEKSVSALQNGPSGYELAPGIVGYRSDLGNTALWESTYKLITHTENKLKTLPKDTKVIVTIFTDGGENASSWEWRDGSKIRQVIQQKQQEGWVINFIGAGHEAAVKHVAQSVGIFASNVANYNNSAVGTSAVMKKMSVSRSSYASKVAKGEATTDGFFEN